MLICLRCYRLIHEQSVTGIQYKVEDGMCVQRIFKSVCASSQFDQSHSFTSDETLDPWLPIERLLKTLIELCGGAG